MQSLLSTFVEEKGFRSKLFNSLTALEKPLYPEICEATQYII